MPKKKKALKHVKDTHIPQNKTKPESLPIRAWTWNTTVADIDD